MKRVAWLAAALLAAGCETLPDESSGDMLAFEAAAPRSILVVPSVNNSLDVDAPDYLLTTLPKPLAEKGYYVFPVNTTKFILQQEGFYEGEQIHRQPPEMLAQLFGADAVLFVTINRWDAQYVLLTTTVTVELDYRMVAKDGAEIWASTQRMSYAPSNESTGHLVADLVVAAISAAVARAAPDYLPLARMANEQAFLPIPDGPYRTWGRARN
jgi:hypothetical protein